MRMEDIFKFLLVAGIIVVGIIKQFRKEAQSTEAPPSDEHGMPLPHEANPLPENWGGETYGGYIPEGPKPAEQLHTPKKPADIIAPDQPDFATDRPSGPCRARNRPRCNRLRPAVDRGSTARHPLGRNTEQEILKPAVGT